MAGHVYHWKHGWIPLTHEAALSKAHGNHAAAAKMLEDAHSPAAGIHSRQDVAKAALDLHHVPVADRPAAIAVLRSAAREHGATDLVPNTPRSATNWGWDRLPKTTGDATPMPTHEVTPHAFDWVRDQTLFDKSNPHQYDAIMGLMDSIEKDGVKTPIVLAHDPETGLTQVIDGNHRLAAALALGIKHVPVRWHGKPPKPPKPPGRHRRI